MGLAGLEKYNAHIDMLKKGGGYRDGLLMEDSKTLKSYGLDYDMSIYEHLWCDTDANQQAYKEDFQKIYDQIPSPIFRNDDEYNPKLGIDDRKVVWDAEQVDYAWRE